MLCTRRKCPRIHRICSGQWTKRVGKSSSHVSSMLMHPNTASSSTLLNRNTSLENWQGIRKKKVTPQTRNNEKSLQTYLSRKQAYRQPCFCGLHGECVTSVRCTKISSCTMYNTTLSRGVKLPTPRTQTLLRPGLKNFLTKRSFSECVKSTYAARLTEAV